MMGTQIPYLQALLAEPALATVYKCWLAMAMFHPSLWLPLVVYMPCLNI
jgi:hypothetical protein